MPDQKPVAYQLEIQFSSGRILLIQLPESYTINHTGDGFEECFDVYGVSYSINLNEVEYSIMERFENAGDIHEDSRSDDRTWAPGNIAAYPEEGKFSTTYVIGSRTGEQVRLGCNQVSCS